MSADMIPLLSKALGETVYMVVVSMIVATIIGVPLGVLLHTTSKGQILESPAVNRVVGAVVNAVRSIPFIILLVAIIPFTRLLVGTAIGTTAAMVPLVIAAIPFIGRQVETSLKEVPFGLVEAAQSMGATPAQIIWKVLLPESMSSIVAQLTTVIISLVGESAMAGAVGGGGLGDLAIRYGYQRFRPEIMLATVIILIVLVQLVQFVGNPLAKRLHKREKRRNPHENSPRTHRCARRRDAGVRRLRRQPVLFFLVLVERSSDERHEDAQGRRYGCAAPRDP